MPGEDGVVDGRDDRPLVAVDAGKGLFAAGDPGEQVGPHLVFDRADAVAGRAQLAEGVDLGHGGGG